MRKFWLLMSVVLGLIGFQSTIRAADPVFDIPRLDKIQIDGDGADWGDRGFRVEALCDSADRIRTRLDFDASFRLGWDERGLLVLVNVTDDIDVEEPELVNIWKKDSVEFFVGKEVGTTGALWQAVVAPGVNKDFPEPRSQTYDFRKKADYPNPLKFEAQRVKTEHGYVLEALLPWENLGIKPANGTTVAFQMYVNDVDAKTRNQATWYPKPGMPYATKFMYTLRLADQPSDAVKAAAWGKYEHFRRTRVNVLASADMAGKAVSISDGDHPLASGTLNADDGRATASITFAMPPAGQAYGPLSVSVDGKAINTVTLADPEDRRREEFSQAQVVFNSAVMSADGFPTFEFDQPSHVEDLIGPYTLSARFFDADYNEVTRCEKPGRYGAVIDVKTDDGKDYTKFTTLFRVVKPVGLYESGFHLDLTLPAGFGIDPQVLKDQAQPISNLFSLEFGDNGEHPSNRAVMLAGLYETKSGARSATRLDDFTARDYAWWFGLKKKLGLLPHYAYLAYTPDAYDADPAKKWPVIIAMHGAGANGEDPTPLKLYGLANMAERKKVDQRFILLVPQCVRGEFWHPQLLDAYLDEMMTKYRIDPDRIYVTGGSMGAIGAYDWGLVSADRLAAIAPLSGYVDARDAERIKDLPIWTFHGDDDHVVPIDRDVTLFARMKEIGGQMRFTIFNGGGHGIDGPAYTPEFFDWLLQQVRGKPQQAAATQPVNVPFEQ